MGVADLDICNVVGRVVPMFDVVSSSLSAAIFIRTKISF